MGIKRALKIITIQLLLFLTLACSDDSQDEAKYVGSRNSNIYHYADCKWAKNILSKNLVEFGSIEEAHRRGYKACKTCKPPSYSRGENEEGALGKRKPSREIPDRGPRR